jgi:uncharacterized membrane protein
MIDRLVKPFFICLYLAMSALIAITGHKVATAGGDSDAATAWVVTMTIAGPIVLISCLVYLLRRL